MTAAPSARRLTAIRVVAAVMAASAIGFGIFTIVFGIVGPDQEIHAVHNAIVASLLLVLSAPPSVALARAPERPMRPLVVLSALSVAAVATMALSLTVDPFTLPFVVLTAVLWALVGGGRDLVPAGRPSPVMLVAVAVGAVPLVAYAVAQAALQRTDETSAHDAFFHWVEASFYAAAVVLLGLIAAVRPRAFRLAAWSAGLALAVLGAASLVLGQHASAIASPWSWAALLGGLLFVALGEWEARRAEA